MKRSNLIGGNPFAALDSDSDDDDDQIEPAEDPEVVSDSPVSYALKIHWTKEKAVAELKNFNVQNIKKDRAGVLYLQFERESEGAKVLDWIRQKHKLKFTATKVPLRTDPKCFLCHRDGHWGNECSEGLLASFPQEIIRLIGSNLLFTELLRLKLVNRSFNTAIKSMSVLVAKDPYKYEGEQRSDFMKFKCDFLKTFQSLESLTLSNISIENSVSGEFNVVDYITQCQSLKSLTLGRCKLPDPQNFTKIFSMMRLTKLIVKTKKELPDSLLPHLATMTNLVDLGLCTTTDDVFDNSLDSTLLSLPKLTRLELMNEYTWAREARLILSEDNLTRLVSLKTRSFRAGIFFGSVELNKLEELDVDYMEHWYPLIAPNLTRLVCGTPKVMDNINDFVNLKYLSLEFAEENKMVISLPNLEILHLWRFKDADLSGCTKLKKLIANCFKDFMLKMPPTITDLTVDPTNACPEALKAISELPNLERLKISRSHVLEKIITALAGITSLQILSFNNADIFDGNFMKNLAQLTQLKILDLVHVDRWSIPKNLKNAEPLVLQLSSKLPHTKILHGAICNRDTLIPEGPHSEYCTCSKCRGADINAIEDWKRESAEEKEARLHTPAKFNKFWYQ